MARGRSNFKMGTVEMIVLFLLSKGELYGHDLAKKIKELSEGDVEVTESTLYPTLYKLLGKSYISDREEPIGKRRVRVYYRLTDAGKQRLVDLLEDYEITMRGINKILANDAPWGETGDEDEIE